IELVKKQLNTFHIPALLFFGRRDEVIPYTVGEQFAEGVALAKLTVLERGHYFIDEKINPMLEEAMHFI
ncbi:MAG TPA: hypothetical protein PKE14_08865, partial [Chitinophagales bacterium]|nr:hypothetical protein [Chitinophagales bacterium]